MEKFEGEDLKTAIEVDPEVEMLERIKSLESDRLELHPKIKKLLLEGLAQKYTMEIGGKSPHEYCTDLLKKDKELDDDVKDIIYRMGPSKTPINREIHDFIFVLPNDIGFEGKSFTREEIYERAKQLNLDLCPPETGPEFGLLDKGIGQHIDIGMEPIIDSEGIPRIFNVSHDSSRVYTRKATDPKLHPAWGWLFELRKKVETKEG